MPEIQILPSILAADQSILSDECTKAELAGGDQIHIDVMDGIFVSNTNFSPEIIIKALKKTNIPQDVHLMVQDPGPIIPAYIDAGADTIHIHIESNGNTSKILRNIRNFGVRSGLAINPDTSVDNIFCYLDNEEVDNVLIMSVYPGLGGQSFISTVQSKIKEIRNRFPEIDITMDGGIDHETIIDASSYGANIFVAGSYLFQLDNMKQGVEKLRTLAKQNYAKNT